MRRTEIILWIAAAVLAITVTVVCLTTTPSVSDTASVTAETLALDEHGTVSFHVNLNTADRLELMRLPGMTAATAQAILDYRAHYGRFTDVREIGNVAGVTEAMRDRWIEYLTLGDESSR